MDYIEAYTNTFDALKNALAKLASATPMQASTFYPVASPMQASTFYPVATPMKATTPIVEHFDDTGMDWKIDLEMTNFLKKYNLNTNIIRHAYLKFELKPALLNDYEKKHRLQVLNGLLAILNDEYKAFSTGTTPRYALFMLFGAFMAAELDKNPSLLNSIYFLYARIINLLIFEVNPNRNCPTLNPKHGPSIDMIKSLNDVFPALEPERVGKRMNDLKEFMDFDLYKNINFKHNMLLSDVRNVAVNFNIHPTLLSPIDSELRIQLLENFKQMPFIDDKIKMIKDFYTLIQRIIDLFILETKLCKPVTIKPQNYIPMTTTKSPMTTMTTAKTSSSMTSTFIPITSTMKPAETSGGMSQNTIIIIVVTIILLLIAIGLFIYFYNTNNTSGSSLESPSIESPSIQSPSIE